MTDRHPSSAYAVWRRLARAGWNLLPLLIAISGWFATLFLCRVMLTRERAQIVQTAALSAKRIQSKIIASIGARVAPLEALGTRWGADGESEPAAQELHRKHPEFESILWQPAAKGAVRPEHRTTISATGSPAKGGRRFQVAIPVFHQEAFAGTLIAVLRTDEWMKAAVDAEIPPGYGGSVSEHSERIYLRDLTASSGPPPYYSDLPVDVYGATWVVQVWPTRDQWTGSYQILSALSLVIGLLIYVSGALAVSARRRARQLESARQEMVTHQEDLRHANEQLATVIQASPFAIVAMDLTGSVQSWNLAAERTFGWRSEEVIGQPPPFIGAEHREEFQDKIARTAAGELIAGEERRRRKKDGTSIDVAVWTAPLRDAQGSVSGIIAAITDISETKGLEERLRHSQKMEAVGRLAGGVAHDFNNLLTIINGYGHMMLKSLPVSDRLHSHAEEILKAGNQAAALTAQLLAFSRRQIIQPKPIDLNHVITDIEKMLRRVIGEDIVFRTDLSPTLQPVKADPNQMGQVLINLAANARDAMPRGGMLTVTTQNVALSEREGAELAGLPAGAYVKLTVTDTGEGMSAETRSHLFEPFFTTKEIGKGTGLGLSSVYGSVQQNGGGIAVTSERGKGTTFSIYLSQLQETAQPTMAVAARNGAGGSETILLVEDESALRNMLRATLANAGYRVLEATDGADALWKWEKEARSIDLLITDVVMPLVNGRELARRLGQLAPRMQVLYMSGYAADVIAYHGILEAGTHFIQKPFLPDALRIKVREVLDARKPADARPPLYQGAASGMGLMKP
ncbi:MAG: PAS domain S-box protein [Candidatus Solibacter usitatus]|nr:PAS domain S-box protein [Candidatus Solibacter usitatus]